jgi:hypothetical protein
MGRCRDVGTLASPIWAEFNAASFLSEIGLKALPGIDSDSANFPLVQREGESGAPIRGVPPAIAAAYWLKEAQQKNKTAVLLVWACTQETLKRRADAAFGVMRSEEEYNQDFDFLVRLFNIAEDQTRELLDENLGQATEIDRLRGLLDYAEQMGLWDIGRQRDEE